MTCSVPRMRKGPSHIASTDRKWGQQRRSLTQRIDVMSSMGNRDNDDDVTFASSVDFVVDVDGVARCVMCECHKTQKTRDRTEQFRKCRGVCKAIEHPPSPDVAGSPHGDMWHVDGRPFAMSTTKQDCYAKQAKLSSTFSQQPPCDDTVQALKVKRMCETMSGACGIQNDQLSNETSRCDTTSLAPPSPETMAQDPRKRWSYSSDCEEFQHNELDCATKQYVPQTPVAPVYIPPSPGFLTPETSPSLTNKTTENTLHTPGSRTESDCRHNSNSEQYHTPTDQPIRRAPPPWHSNPQWVPRGATKLSAPVHPSTFVPGATAPRQLPPAQRPTATLEMVLREVRQGQSTLLYMTKRINALTAAVHDLANTIRAERNQQ